MSLRKNNGAGNSQAAKFAGRRRRIAAAVVAVIALWGGVRLTLRFAPFAALDAFIVRPCSTRVYDRNGVLLQVLPLENGLRREWYDLDALPPAILRVFIAAEDENFYRHGGVDMIALVRAFVQNAKSGRPVSGASTVTMQLARLVVPRDPGKPVSVGVKLAEAFTAVRIESKLPKKRILELYLNSLPFGLQAEGVGSAARTYFGTTPDRLSEAQIHALAVIPRRPVKYNPLEDPGASFEAAAEIGKRTGFSVTKTEWIDAVSVGERYEYPLGMPHFVLYVRNSAGGRLPPELHTSVDVALSDKVANDISTQIALHADARLSHGAALVIDNVTGEILCWAGSGDFFSENEGQIDGVLVRNQSGSTMKPFIYALALERGFTPSSVLADVPMDFGSEQVYVPLNFNNQYNGPVLLRNALASSLNIPAVYLLYRLGVDNYLKTLGALGFDSLAGERNRQGLSLALGSGEVTLFELVRAFSVFARGGTIPSVTYLKAGAVSAEPAGSADFSASAAVYEPDTAALICDILSDRRARALGFGFAEVFSTPYPAIFKTGTSNQFQNIIALGSTARYTAGVWMGNFTGETVVRETGSSVPAAVVRGVLDVLSERNPETAATFAAPRNYRKLPVCAVSGMAPGPDCPAVTDEYVALAAAANRPVCSWHYRQNGRVHVRYPQEYQRWLSGRNTAGALADTGEGRILYPADGAVFVFDPSIPSAAQKIKVDCTGAGARAELFVNGVSAGTSERPFSWFVPLLPGEMRLTVRFADGRNAAIRISVK